MKKITLLVAAAMTALSAFAYEIPDGADQVEIYAMEVGYASNDTPDGAGSYYKWQGWFSLASDFADAEQTLSPDFNGMMITYTGDIENFRFEVVEFNDGAEGGKFGPFWAGENDAASWITLDGSAITNSATEKTIYVDLAATGVSEHFATGDAGFHIHLGDVDVKAAVTFSKVVFFKAGATGIGAVAAEDVESAKPFIYNGMTVFPTEDGKFINALGVEVDIEK